MTLARSRLLARVLASEARVVRLWAPPAYGKSSLARLFARQFDRHAICDCAGVSDAVDFAGRAFSALAGESQGGGDSVSLTRLRLHAIEADEATWSRALLEAWKSRQEPSLLILEHAEAIAAVPAALALLGDVLATRPAERVILISSRIACRFECRITWPPIRSSPSRAMSCATIARKPPASSKVAILRRKRSIGWFGSPTAGPPCSCYLR